jgi:hypothetical protein
LVASRHRSDERNALDVTRRLTSDGTQVVLLLGALLSFAGAVLALWLVREREIEREPVEPESESDPESRVVPESAAA